ncbi:MAG: glycosyltransferase [Bryobacteraceae bacterium]|nr:glycosyltransferase [Bryobacteraceae bacterium]
MKLLIVSHVIHFRHQGGLYAYGPYAREIDLWADLFPEVRISCPIRDEVPPGDCVAFSRPNISLVPLPEAGGETTAAKLILLAYTPLIMWGLMRAMLWADAIHVRCPGNIGLLGAFMAPFFSRNLVAKYAGSWMEMPGEEFTTRAQRWLLRHWFRGPVTVYGEWPGQPAHIIPFFTSLTTEEQMNRARRAVAARQPSSTIRALYTGRLSKAKNIDCMLEAAAAARTQGAAVECTIIGDGPERENLEATARRLGISDVVHFTGGVAFETVIEHLEKSDVLVLTSETEGWPKSAAEAMAFGLICIGSNRGFFRKMLDGRGIAVEPRDVGALAAAFTAIAKNPRKYEEMRGKAAAWAQQFSMEGLRDAIRALLEKHWSVRLSNTALREVSNLE